MGDSSSSNDKAPPNNKMPATGAEEDTEETSVKKRRKTSTTTDTTRRDEEFCLLQELPAPVLDKMLVEYLDIPSLVQLAGCSSAWRKTVYDNTYDHPQLWKVIDFNRVAPTHSARITDLQLGALLRNCRAQARCRELKLTGCVQVRGDGLRELEGSCALREIDLRLSLSNDIWGCPEIVVSTVLPVLSSMPPFVRVDDEERLARDELGLSLVKFSPQEAGQTSYYELFGVEIADWLKSFSAALGLEAQQKNISCLFCQRSLAQVAGEENMHDWMTCVYCEACKKRSCLIGNDNNSDCPIVKQCVYCLFQCCQPCDESPGQCPTHKPIYSCDFCDREICEDCFVGYQCDSCGDVHCSDRACQQFIEVCACREFFCPNCLDEHQQTCTAHKREGAGEGEQDESEEVDEEEVL